MKRIHRRGLIFSLVKLGVFVCVVGSCDTRLEQTLLKPSQRSDKEVILQELRIDNFDGILDSQAAIDVAKIHSLSLGIPTRGDADREVLNVLPLKNEEGDPIMYVINYKNNHGYTIVSATKKYFPIIAEADEGRFDERVYKSGIGLLLEDYKQEIARYAKLPQDSVAVFAGLWRQYINYKNQQSLPIQTRTGDLLELVSNSMALWESQGYSFQMLGDGCPDGLPQSEYERFCAIAESSTHPDYAEDYLIHSFILIANPDVAAGNVHTPLMNTTWHQDRDYNLYSPIRSVNPEIRYQVGCAAVASGQIMRYHEWPETYNWSSMLNSTATATTAAFLRDVAIHEQMSYQFQDSSAFTTMRNVKTALINDFDYLCDADSVYNYGAIMNSIDLLRPVYVRGENSVFSGHAWVCDGYYTYPNTGYYELQCLDLTYPLTYVMSTSYGYYDQCRMFHNNWGEQGVYNGWWQQDYYRNYDYNKKIISNIRPNN